MKKTRQIVHLSLNTNNIANKIKHAHNETEMNEGYCQEIYDFDHVPCIVLATLN